ncbi:uncharacterized protein M437DRAFT_60859 [Aureobasidium melanogenum CBS 110374]|uniref:Uncharacterized protein n=1 Tax=Aureobasidium melanogenum (strain CBS 110374) TaxID=1043003 RepID=A0A074W5H0_AURM1|nr:uncharacterized protein M437DRAFT_60859 [Aureobasidium melanogenum CBS 110374]KEQ57826.1 hypothetical protein M437DRAFT_60859 [Aureobasidium melanogenum CBS 110374]
MGATLSSPQLGDGLVLVANPNTTGPFTSAFTVDASDTNSFGFSATMMNMGTVLQVQYTNTANIVKTATCSAQTYSYITYTDYYDDNGGHVTSTGYRTDADTTFASIFCPIANTQIGTGPMILSLSNRPNDPTWFPSPATYALYFGPTSVTASQDPITTTSLVPGQTTYLATVTSTVYGTTETVASTTTLTGTYSASRCPVLPISSPTTLSTSTRSSSSARSSSQTHSASASSSKSLSSKSSSKIISSSSKASTLSRTASSSKSSSSKTSTSSRNASKSASSKAFLTTSSTKTSSKSTSTSKISVCSTGTALKSLSNYPSIASHLCQDILRSKRSFPRSISVWPASQLSSACSCYAQSSPTNISTPPRPSLSKRFPVVERPDVSSSKDSTFSNSSSVSSSSTTLVPTTVLGYGPPDVYSIPTTTISTTVYVTGNRTILPTTTTIVSLGTTTVTENSTITIDLRTSPTTCIPNLEDTKVTLSARSLTCENLKLHTAFLWIMMKDPFDFCAYYLTANRNTSPLLEMSASTLKDTCNCLVTHKSAPLPAFKVGPPYSPKPKRQCNQSVASLIKVKFKEPKTFCKYYTSTSRNISPFSILRPGDVFVGCSCLI